jgi:hypothetical protein
MQLLDYESSCELDIDITTYLGVEEILIVSMFLQRAPKEVGDREWRLFFNI